MSGNYYEDGKNLNPERVPNTCEWFFGDDKFHQWRDNNVKSLLWVSAGPGCGKSVLSRALVDEKRLTLDPENSDVCYFFFKDGDKKRMHANNALCAILHQLFIQPRNKNLIKNALPSYENFPGDLSERTEELWRILVQCAESEEARLIVCVLDGLDECDEESQQHLLDLLEQHYLEGIQNRPTNLKFLITSRPYVSLEDRFSRFSAACMYLRFNGDDKSEQISQEVSLVIDAKLEELTVGFEIDDRHAISQRLKSTQHRTYLWLHLIFGIIKQSRPNYGRRVDMEDLLSSLPSQVSDAYEKILARSTHPRRTELLLQIVLAATRPLTLEEANYALALALSSQGKQFETHAELSTALWPKDTFQSLVTNMCGLFISVYKSQLFFIHHTAREFLISRTGKLGAWQGRLDVTKSHSVVSLACLQFLFLFDIKGPDLGPTANDTEGDDLIHMLHSRYGLKYGFLAYSGENWPFHFISQDSANIQQSRDKARRLCSKSDRASVWAPGYLAQRNQHYSNWTDLALASLCGLQVVVEDMMSTGEIDVDQYIHGFGTALTAASGNGHEEVVNLCGTTGHMTTGV